MSRAKCPRCRALQDGNAKVCTACGASMSVAKTVDDLAPVEARGGTVPRAPASAAVQPAHIAPAVRPGQSAQNRAAATYMAAGAVVDGKYAIVRLLGQGGMGVVYLARDIHTGIDVVLKSVRSELAHRADVRARTLAEGRVLGQIDHPNVVHLKAVVVDDKSLWLVMQYIDGESLDRTIDRYAEQKTFMPLVEALGYFRQIASGIAAAHEEGVIHRDLKPANVLIRKKDGVAKVTDFGIAKVEHDDGAGRVQTRGVIGSIWYMSPEQVTGRRDLDKRVDIYALGVLLFQMLTGRVPFDADSDYEIMRAQAETPMPLARSIRPDLPLEIDPFLQHLCAKKRDERFASCEDVLAALSVVEAEIAASAAALANPAPTAAVIEAASAVAPNGAPPGAAPVAATTPASTDGGSVDVAIDTTDLRSKPEHRSAPPSASAALSKDMTAPPVASTRDIPDGGVASKPDGDEAKSHPPPPNASSKGLGAKWITLGLILFATGSLTTLVMSGVLSPPSAWLSGGVAPQPSQTATAEVPLPAPSESASAAPPTSPFDSLVGTWIGSNDRAVDAVRVADAVELRVSNPKEFAPAQYDAGETRFVLRPIPGQETVFAVEDRLRPDPPVGYPFNRDRARSTCQDIRSEVGGAPLRATLDGSRLTLELFKIEPGERNFILEKGETISCVGLSKLKASKVIGVLIRK